MDQVVPIPLYGRGGLVRGYALVDADDAGRLRRHRWHLNAGGYAFTTDGVLMHRVVMGLEPGDPRATDHINRNRLDNRKENLRVATHEQNAQNRTRNQRGSSQYRGVCWAPHQERWKAYGVLAGRRHHLGYFDSEDEAGRAAAAWRAAHMPYSDEGGLIDEPPPAPLRVDTDPAA